MKHTYTIAGMTCNGCRAHVEKTLANVEGVTNASVDLAKAEAILEMDKHIPLKSLQTAMQKDGGHYSIHELGSHHHKEVKSNKVESGNGVFYCPMHCEGEKVYDKAGDCWKRRVPLAIKVMSIHVPCTQKCCEMRLVLVLFVVWI